MPDHRKTALACDEPLRELDGFISALSLMAFGKEQLSAHPELDETATALHSIAAGLKRNAADLRKALELEKADHGGTHV